MNKEKVDLMFERYREYKARCLYLEQGIDETKKIIEILKKSNAEDLISFSAGDLTGVPSGKYNISDPTGRLGDFLAKGGKSEHLKQAEEELQKMEIEYNQKIPTVIFVNAWVTALDNKERFVIEEKVLGGLSWRQLVYSFRREFGDTYSQQGLKKIRTNAMEKIYKIAQ